MHADVTRTTFEPALHYTRVLMQQGRVQLDADFNEQVALLLYAFRTFARHVIGPHGGPQFDAGFEITPEESAGELTDLGIGVGCYYVDGLLCENRRAADDKDGPSYFHQPDLALDPECDELPDLPFLVYLDAFEQHVPVPADPFIREVALGQADTATRARLTWQVRTYPLQGGDQINAIEPAFDDIVDLLQPTDGIRVRARRPDDADDCPCVLAEDARYRGLENQLYRVEVHRGGDASDGDEGSIETAATFKWSRDNGSVIFPIRDMAGATVFLDHLGRDDRSSLRPGDVVEVVDDAQADTPDPHPLLTVKEVDPVGMRVALGAPPEGSVGEDRRLHPFLRRWDHRVGDPDEGALLGHEGAALILGPNGADRWLDLEDGLQVQFEEEGTYRAGDYFEIPARTATGDVYWRYAGGAMVPPHGVAHHYAPLAVVYEDGGIQVSDARRIFEVLPTA
jgi:Family of unknown function (DUF6519)